MHLDSFLPLDQGVELFKKILTYNILDDISTPDDDEETKALKLKYPRFTSKFLSEHASSFTSLNKSSKLSAKGEEFARFCIDVGFKAQIGVFPSIAGGLDFKNTCPELNGKTVLHLTQRLGPDYCPDYQKMAYLNTLSAIRFETPDVLKPLHFEFTTVKDTPHNKGFKAAHYFCLLENVHIWFYGKFDIFQPQPSIADFKKVHSSLLHHIHHQLIPLFFYQALFDKYKAAVSTEPWGGSYKKPTHPSTQMPISHAYASVKHARNEIGIALANLKKQRKSSDSSTSAAASSSSTSPP